MVHIGNDWDTVLQGEFDKEYYRTLRRFLISEYRTRTIYPSMYDIFNGDRYADMPVLCRKYGLFPDAEDWKGRILLLETSEEKPAPEAFRQALLYLKEAGVFDAVSGVLVGKPMDETHMEEYRQLLPEVIDRPELPIVFNLNIGHAKPRCILPFGVEAVVDAKKQSIRFLR